MADLRIRRPRLAILVHLVRCGVVVLLMLAIPPPRRPGSGPVGQPPPRDAVYLPAGSASIGEDPDDAGLWPILDQEGNLIGTLARTMPAAKNIVGYRGPTESAITLDANLQIVGVRLIGSSDTDEHVEAVRNDESFFQQFQGWAWGGPANVTKIDGVSGATLTSLALAEGVLRRIGGDRPCLVFPQKLTTVELSDLIPAGTSVTISGNTAILFDSKGNRQGRFVRSGPLTSSIVGYQGPTELLIQVSPENRIESLRIRESFDNEPYVDYVRTERKFWKRFENQVLEDIADLDFVAEGVEGVSGATMTSLAVAETIVASAQELSKPKIDTGLQRKGQIFRWTAADAATIAVLIGSLLLHRAKLFRSRWGRPFWLLLVIVVIGFWAGNLVSMALVAGWSAEGVAWRLAPGLAAIAVTALMVPPITKSNPYCNHLCPHGALQQLIRPAAKSKRHRHLSRRLTQILSQIPSVAVVVAYIMLVLVPTTDFSSWEPFHAYLFRIAGWSSIVLAIASLGVAAFLPMGYCRFGCPTGRLIDYLRRTASSDKFRKSDAVALGLLIFVLLVRAN